MIWLGVILTGLVILYNFTKTEDPKLKKKLGSDGRLVALQTFTCRGRVIKRGTKGARVCPEVEFDMGDNSWADADSEITKGKVTGDSFISKSRLHNWRVYGSEVISCDCEEKYLEHLSGLFKNGVFENEVHKGRNW